MIKKVIDLDMFVCDIKEVTAHAYSLKQQINNIINRNDIYSRIEQKLKNIGYDYLIDKNAKCFVINISSDLSIIGEIGNISVMIGISIRLNELECTNIDARCGMIDIPIADFDSYLPLIDKMITECEALVKKYERLLKKEKSAELLEVLVHNYLPSLNEIYIKIDAECIYWMSMKVNSDVLVRAPIDFDYYQSQCDAWLKVVNDRSLWYVEHKDVSIEVLKLYSYHIEDMATGKLYYDLKV